MDKSFCCKELSRILNEPESGVEYSPKYRLFTMDTYTLPGCPFCGKTLPCDLGYFRDYIVRKELGLSLRGLTDEEVELLLPREFFSDEWWKNRQQNPFFPTRHETREEVLKARAYDHNTFSDEKRQALFEKILKQEAEDISNLEHFCCVHFKMMFDPKDEDCRFSPYQQNCSYYPVFYEPEKRRFKLSNFSRKELIHKWPQRNNQTFRKLHFFIKFCPECGSRLPQSLAKEWFEIVREKFGITDLSDYKAISKLPEKYLTEEWWREAGL